MTCKLSLRVTLLFLLVACAQFLRAQQFATLNVTITDPSGRLVPNAHVTLSNPGMGIERNQTADRAGSAVLTAISAGDYRLIVRVDGFSDYERRLTLTVGQVASVSVQLGIASIKQAISVSESTTAVDTEKNETSQVIHSSQIQDLPIAGRDFSTSCC